ncbi:pilus assembly protein N-terminal domain-containing protein [Pseudovibrio exalbescens]|uniref:pilus assembly protein N-terminal domain-containing protein n=1 Tax=Pseudovibrio exalbescens TaxID=197461 RepID=UPI000C9C281F|nr:pilus assembly protein N-terminal domain-containing protein [Pseudovibrio exalbescens]
MRYKHVKTGWLSALIIGVGLAGIGGITSSAHAKEVSVFLDQAKVFRIEEPAGTVILGNPAIADVTLHDRMTIVVTGKSYGVTNLIVLNEQSEPIVDDQIVVRSLVDNMVTVQRNTNRFSYSCKPDCEPLMRVGDQKDFYENTAKQVEMRNTLGENGSLPRSSDEDE